MDTSLHNLKGLFLQLGLSDQQTAIDQFIEHNSPLPATTNLANAPFLNANQQSFIRQQWELDSDWCVVIDELDSLLRP